MEEMRKNNDAITAAVTQSTSPDDFFDFGESTGTEQVTDYSSKASLEILHYFEDQRRDMPVLEKYVHMKKVFRTVLPPAPCRDRGDGGSRISWQCKQASQCKRANEIQCPVIPKLTSTERRKYRVCYKHFEETSFLCFAQRKKLKNDAVPTLHLPVQSEKTEYAHENVEAEEYPASATPLRYEDANHEELITPRIDVVYEETAWDIDGHNEAGPSTSGQLQQCSTPQKNQNVLLRGMKKCQLTPTAGRLYNVAKKLLKRNRYANRKREDLKTRLERARALSESSLINRFENLSDTQKMFIEMQLRTSRSMPQGRRYTTDEKILALALLKQSPKSYKLLRKLCNLPSETTLKKMLRKIPVETGVSQVVMEHLHRQADTMSAQDKLCILMWDEMSLKSHVDYNANTDKIIGFEDYI
ncbi:uncharacterized protein LOC143212401 [Lasioglossum baleicum]|uniref:uncharacterized protein LOC143212401 n=1 Tax=Lasioglossum baleicum TaxID=434251 RepID=UPI003FCD6DD6